MDRVEVIKQRFADKHIKASIEWLEGCISWFVAEEPSISLDSLFKRTYDQWLLGDVQEVSEPCLPDSLFADRSDVFDLSGSFAVQMNFVLDISESPYDQLRVLHNRVLDATDEEKIEQRQRVKKHRMLRLELTDGSRTITATEHRPISTLSTKLVPGCKVLLSGPIKCINKILFLVPRTIQLLGGELDTLLITNAYENVLLRLLNKPIKTNPITNYEESTVREEHRNQQPRLTSRPAVFSKPPEVDPFDDDPMDDDFIIAEALAKVEEIERKSSMSQGTVSNQQPPPSSSGESLQDARMRELLPDFHDFIDSSLLLNDDEDDAFNADAIQLAMESPSTAPRNNAIFEANYEFQFLGAHLSTIEQIQAQQIEVFTGKAMIVKAKFEAVVEKLRFEGAEATMSILVQDSWSRGKLRVQIGTDVMNSLLMYDAKELKEMFKNIPRQPQVRDEIQVALDDLKDKIQGLNSFIRVNFVTGEGFILQEILPATSALNSAMAQKIKKERLVVVK